MSAKQLELVSGLVERISEKGTGIKVGGEWCNASQYVTPPLEMPKPGQRVNLQVERTDRGIWIQSIEVLDGGQIHQLPVQPRRGGGGGRSPAEQRDIRRLSVLKAAAAFGASRPELKSADVLTLADRWIAWVEQPDRKGGEAGV
jgi:hypothetical protein